MATKKIPAAKAKKAAPKAKTKAKAKAPAKAKVTAKAKASPKKPVAKPKAAAKKVVSKNAAPKKAAPKKAAAKNTVPKKVTPKKAAAKKAAPKKVTPKKANPKKVAAKKAAPKKKSATKKAVTKIKAMANKAVSKAAPKAKTNVAAKKSAPKKPKSISKVSPIKPDAHLQVGDFVPYVAKRGEEYMNEAQREHFKRILRNWRNELMEEVDRTVHHMQDEAANPPDPADRATLEEEFSIELRTRDRERRLIKKIDSTIELIVKDDYGYCDSCGIEIGIRRLEARPTANKCIDCKTLDEIKEKQLGA